MAGDGIPQQSVIWPYLELTSDVMTQPTTYCAPLDSSVNAAELKLI